MRTHPAVRHPDLIVGIGGNDDAGVIRLSSDRALVQTVDFFTPIVDDPYDWGRIAAANALSDIYAMGATPLSALQIVGWPRDVLPFGTLGEVLRGGADVMAEAECVIVGGHSIDDAEPKYGFAVSGMIHPDRVVTNAGAQVGDVIVLTKPIGTGIIATAVKQQACPPEVLAAAVEVMTRLNGWAAKSLHSSGVHACTDVTGFGLLGHLAEMIDGADIGARLNVSSIPVIDGTRDLLRAGFYPGGSERNLAAVQDRLDFDVDEHEIRLLADAQTSGGLLISLPSAEAHHIPGGTVIGVMTDSRGRIELE